MCVVAVLLFVGAASAPAVAAPKARCKAGKIPVVKKVAKRVAYVRDRKGRVRCRKPALRRPVAPAAEPSGQLTLAAGQVRDALAVDPDATARIQKLIGRPRTRRLLDAMLVGWTGTGGAARAAADPGFSGRYAGVDGSVAIDVQQLAGADSGFTATGSIQGTVSREALGSFGSQADKDLPAEIKSASGKLDVAFTDSITKCSDGNGKQPGKVKASGKVTLTVERDGLPPVTVELSAEVEATYTARVGEDGKWTGIDDVTATTTLQTGGSGQKTDTYRARRVGSGFGTDSILDARGPKVGAAIERDVAAFDNSQGGIFGPKGSWRGTSFPISDLRTEANVIAMVKASVASTLATLAVVEYLRKVTRERAEKTECGGRYAIALRVDGQAIFATHDASGTVVSDAVAEPVGGNPRTATAWTGSGPGAWSNLVFTTKSDCPYVAPISTGTLQYDIVKVADDRIQVTWTTSSGGSSSTASVDCPSDGEHDPPPIPGQPGPALIGASPTSFELPIDGGTQPLGGGFTDAGSGWTVSGAIVVTRQP